MSNRNQHEWDFIENTPNGELAFCRLCNQFRFGKGKPFKGQPMERSVAIRRLGKLLGKKFGYQIDNKAPSRDEREAAKVLLTPAIEDRKKLGEQMTARKNALLAADAEYQSILADYAKAGKLADQLMSTSHRYKITVGVSESIFFRVEAQGDTWEEIFAKLDKKAQPDKIKAA